MFNVFDKIKPQSIDLLLTEFHLQMRYISYVVDWVLIMINFGNMLI